MLRVDVDRIKREIDLVDYIEKTASIPAKKEGAGWAFNPCPRCGGHGHFKVWNESGIWLFKSFSTNPKCSNISGSIIDYVQLFEGYSGFQNAVEHLANQYPFVEIAATDDYQERTENNNLVRQRQKQIAQAKDDKPKKRIPDLAADFEFLCSQTAKENYFASRAISVALQKRYKLSSHPKGLAYFVERYPDSFVEKSSGFTTSYKHLIPIINADGTITHLLPRLDADSAVFDKQPKILNLKGRTVRFFNDRYLTNPALAESEYIFIVEGVFDALTFEELGYAAISINSASNTGKLIEMLADHLKNNPNKYSNKTFVIAGDNDSSGQSMNAALTEGLKRLRLDYAVFDFDGVDYKDANEWLLADRDRLQNAVDSFLSHVEAPDLVANHLNDYIEEMMSNREKKGISTGFPQLDQALGGGLYSGLYTIGATSSLGKTTLVLQIADYIAASGTDVLFYSLEMRKAEIIAKSFSRISYELVANEEEERAYSTRDILNGTASNSLYSKFSQCYSPSAYYLHLIEGNFRTNVATIRSGVERHIKKRKTKPVVVIDYLQILQPQPEHERLSDKQVIDRNVVALKQLSRDYDIPVILISSVNRESYTQAISYSSFKESGAIEYSSDVVIGLQLSAVMEAKATLDKEKRAEILDNAKKQVPREVDLIILKNRNGAPYAKLPFVFSAPFNYFEEGV